MLFRLALRNVFRNVRRSLLTAGMVTLGSALLCVSVAWMQGVFTEILDKATASAGHVRVVDPEFAKLEKMMPLYANVPDAEALATQIQGLATVQAAYPRIAVGVTITNTDEIGDHFALLMGAPVSLFEHQYQLKDSVLDGGRWFEAPDDVLLGRKLAAKLDAKLGDEIIMNGMTQDGSFSAVKGRLVGIVAGENPVQERQAFMAIERVQYLTDMPDAATEILIFGQHRDDATAMVSELTTLDEAQTLTVQPWSNREPWAGLVAMLGFINGIIMVIIVFITALGVWNTMTISVMERTAEIGVLRAMGMKRLHAVVLFVIEALMIGLIGGLFGVLLGGIPAYYLEVVGVSVGQDVVDNMDASMPFSQTLRADLNTFVVLMTFCTAMSMAFVGSALPAARAAFIQPVEAMRARR